MEAPKDYSAAEVEQQVMKSQEVLLKAMASGGTFNPANGGRRKSGQREVVNSHLSSHPRNCLQSSVDQALISRAILAVKR